jgi:hypothetical protein
MFFISCWMLCARSVEGIGCRGDGGGWAPWSEFFWWNGGSTGEGIRWRWDSILIFYMWSDAVHVGSGFWRERGEELRNDPAGKMDARRLTCRGSLGTPSWVCHVMYHVMWHDYITWTCAMALWRLVNLSLWCWFWGSEKYRLVKLVDVGWRWRSGSLWRTCW